MLQNIPKIGEDRRQKDCYTANWHGRIYNDRVYAIWTVADIRYIVLPTSFLLVNITCKP
jgi:hypothetical protein